MLEPLKEFVCDHCQEIITSPKLAYLEWMNDLNDTSRAIDFKIVHHDFQTGKLCAVRQTSTKLLEDFTGPDGIGNLLSFIDYGLIVEPEYKGPRAKNIRDFVEIFRRLTIPYYEEGRYYLHMAFEDGFISTNQYGIYRPEKLQIYIEKYGPKFS